jgi:regulator of G protein signaling-like protein
MTDDLIEQYLRHFDDIYLHQCHLISPDDTLTHSILPADPSLLSTRIFHSRLKVMSLFRSFPPLDISISNVEMYGLGALLQSNVPLVYFLRYLLDHWSTENLYFYMDVELYEQMDFWIRHGNGHVRRRSIGIINRRSVISNAGNRLNAGGDAAGCQEERVMAAQRIYETYVRQNAIFEVNLVDPNDKTSREAMQRGDMDCFKKAKDQCLMILQQEFEGFRASTLYQEMISNIGDMHRALYKQEDRHEAANYILRYLECPIRNESVDHLQHELYVRQMARVICRRRLNLRFPQLKNLVPLQMNVEDERHVSPLLMKAMTNSVFVAPRVDELVRGRQNQRHNDGLDVLIEDYLRVSQ